MRDTCPGLVTSLRRADAERYSTTLPQRRNAGRNNSVPRHNNNMSKHEGTERGAQSNSDNSEEKDWAAVKALFDNAKTAKKPRPVSDCLCIQAANDSSVSRIRYPIYNVRDATNYTTYTIIKESCLH